MKSESKLIPIRAPTPPHSTRPHNFFGFGTDKVTGHMPLSLYKEIMLRNDTKGDDYSLHFLRNKQKKEIDFLICLNKRPIVMIEVKTSDEVPSPHFNAFLPQLTKANPKVMQVQLVLNLEREFSTKEGLKVKKLKNWLEQMPF